MPDERVVYKDSITNLLDAHRPRFTHRIRERLRVEAGIDEAALKASYSILTHDLLVKILAEELHPGLSFDESTYEVGRELSKSYGRGILGKALYSLIRMIGPMRTLKRTPEYFRMSNNYADVKIEVTGKTSYILDHNEVGIVPHYWRGTMQGAGEAMGLTAHSVELLSYDGARARFHVRWG